jgi:hypothetical protein
MKSRVTITAKKAKENAIETDHSPFPLVCIPVEQNPQSDAFTRDDEKNHQHPHTHAGARVPTPFERGLSQLDD